MGDDYQIFEQEVDDWECAVKYRVVDPGGLSPYYDVRWWIVTNRETLKFFVCGCDAMRNEPKGHYPKIRAVDGKIEFYMPRKKRTDEELDGIVDIVKGAE